MKIKKMPLDDRPREKILEKGVAVLSNAELLAVLLRTGSKNLSVIEVARSLVDSKEKLLSLRSIKPAELALQKGIGPAKAATVVAAMELGRRIAVEAAKERQDITSTLDAVDLLMPQLRHENQESFLLVLLNAKGQLLSIEKIAQGSFTTSVVEPRDVFHAAIIHKAVAIILAHNHPSGDPKPSDEDKKITDKLVCASTFMNIPIIDHIIIGDGKYFSFQEHDLI